MGTCLVTGGAGFIGCAVSPLLASAFRRVVVVDNLHPQVHGPQAHAAGSRPPLLEARCELVVADITRADTFARLADLKPEAVLHLAAETGTAQSLTESARHSEVNVLGLSRMLDGLAAHGALPRRVVLASSRAVYGEGAWADTANGAVSYPGQRTNAQLAAGQWDFPGKACLPFEATRTEPRPTSIYGATKLAQEQILRCWATAFDVDVTVLRLQNVYGPGQSLTNPYTGILPLFAARARAGEPIPVYEDGRIMRDFVYVDDVAAAIAGALAAPPGRSATYDIGSGTPCSILELAQLVAARYRAPAPVITGMYRKGDVRCAACDVSRTTAETGWRATWTLADGIAALCDWMDAVTPPAGRPAPSSAEPLAST